MALALALMGGACMGKSGAEKDEARVKAATMRLDDLAPGWVPAPPDTSTEKEGDRSRFAQCVGRPEPKTVRTAMVASPQFHVEERSRASSDIQTVRTAAIAADDFAALEGTRAVGCLRQRLGAQLDRESTAGNAPQRFAVERLPGLNLGDRTVAFRAVITYRTHTEYLDLVNVRKDRLEIAASFLNRDAPLPAELELSVLAKMLERA